MRKGFLSCVSPPWPIHPPLQQGKNDQAKSARRDRFIGPSRISCGWAACLRSWASRHLLAIASSSDLPDTETLANPKDGPRHPHLCGGRGPAGQFLPGEPGGCALCRFAPDARAGPDLHGGCALSGPHRRGLSWTRPRHCLPREERGRQHGDPTARQTTVHRALRPDRLLRTGRVSRSRRSGSLPRGSSGSTPRTRSSPCI